MIFTIFSVIYIIKSWKFANIYSVVMKFMSQSREKINYAGLK